MKKNTSLILIVIVAAFWFGCNNPPAPKPCDNSISPNGWKHFISKDSAKKYIDTLYSLNISNQIKLSDVNKPLSQTFIIGKAELYGFGREMMRNMMLRDSCVGFRVYYGLKFDQLKKSFKIIPIICGVDSNGNDIYWQKPTPGGSNMRVAPEDGLMDNTDTEPPVMNTLL